MGKPFKVNEQDPRVDIIRAPDGKFQRLESKGAGDIMEQAQATGDSVAEVVSRERVPDHPIGRTPETTTSGGKVFDQEIPWPPAQEGRSPMKLKS